jgi:hypothetical protein
MAGLARAGRTGRLFRAMFESAAPTPLSHSVAKIVGRIAAAGLAAPSPGSSSMTSMEEFNFIAAQLEWLEEYLREATGPGDDSRMTSALNSLACARAVIGELAHISAQGDAPVRAQAA